MFVLCDGFYYALELGSEGIPEPLAHLFGFGAQGLHFRFHSTEAGEKNAYETHVSQEGRRDDSAASIFIGLSARPSTRPSTRPSNGKSRHPLSFLDAGSGLSEVTIPITPHPVPRHQSQSVILGRAFQRIPLIGPIDFGFIIDSQASPMVGMAEPEPPTI